MFKPGDKVKLKKHIDIYGNKINKDSSYFVRCSYFGKTMEVIILENSYHQGDSKYFSNIEHYVADHFELDVKCMRKQKLNKLCLKMEKK